jgi:hypothetical protein
MPVFAVTDVMDVMGAGYIMNGSDGNDGNDDASTANSLNSLEECYAAKTRCNSNNEKERCEDPIARELRLSPVEYDDDVEDVEDELVYVEEKKHEACDNANANVTNNVDYGRVSPVNVGVGVGVGGRREEEEGRGPATPVDNYKVIRKGGGEVLRPTPVKL